MKKIIQLLVFLLLYAGALNAQWTQITNIPVPASILNIDIDGSTWYAATSGNGVYKSVNNGASWAKLGLDDGVRYPQVQASGSTVVVFSFWDLSLYYSTDGGASFQQGETPGYISSFLVQGNKVFALAEVGLFLSTDYGATFVNTNVVGPGISYGKIVQTPVGKILVYSTYDANTFEVIAWKVHRSTDDVNWTEISGAGGSNPLPTPQNGGYIFYGNAGYANGAILVGILNYDTEGAMYKSTDLGDNWYSVAGNLFVSDVLNIVSNGSRAIGFTWPDVDPFHYISSDLVTWTDISNQVRNVFDGSGTTFVGANPQNQIVFSTNNGASWQPASGNILGNDEVTKYLAAGNSKFVATMNNGIYRATGNAGSWTKVLGQSVNNGGNYVWDLLKKGNAVLAGIDYVAGGERGIYRSINNGNSWTRTHTGAGLCFFDDGGAVFAGVDYEGIFKSTNSGQTWMAMNNGLPAESYLRSPSAFIRSGNKLVASFFSGGIYVSSNNGAGWSKAFTPTTNSVYCLAKSGATLFAGTFAGLWKSTDQGETWAIVQNDVTGSTVTALYSWGDELYIGTGNQGLYRSTDDGETLESHNDGAGDNVFVSFIGREGDKLFAGWNASTEGSGWPYYYYVQADYGRMLWSENAGNLHPSADERAGTSPAKPGLAIFPNPVQDVLQFSTNADPAQVAGIQLINAGGETVRDLSGENLLQPSLNIQDLPNGPYFFRMTMQNGTSLTRRFIVQGKR